MRSWWMALVPVLLCTSVLAQDKTHAVGRLEVGRFDVGRFDAALDALPAPWQVIRFDQRVPATQYGVILWDGVAAVEALANASMALLARPLSVDLARTPICDSIHTFRLGDC